MNAADRAQLQTNLESVRARIAAACARVGRSPREVTLVAVTKVVDVAVAETLFQIGQRDLAENRPQALWEKAAALPLATWHLIGPLQTNKVRRTLPLASLIHSLDRLNLAEALAAEAERLGKPVAALIEVNLAGEESKHGFDRTSLLEFYPRLVALSRLDLRGLMTMARLEDHPERCRPTFAAALNLRDELRERFPNGPRLDILSMGMSNDFEVAIEEGATHVRIGSALFEGLT